jgi:hypothetical protein
LSGRELSSEDRPILPGRKDLRPEITSELLEGDYADGRRMVYLRGANEVTAKLPELMRVLRALAERSK